VAGWGEGGEGDEAIGTGWEWGDELIPLQLSNRMSIKS
jgi:hypothetical protein